MQEELNLPKRFPMKSKPSKLSSSNQSKPSILEWTTSNEATEVTVTAIANKAKMAEAEKVAPVVDSTVDKDVEEDDEITIEKLVIRMIRISPVKFMDEGIVRTNVLF